MEHYDVKRLGLILAVQAEVEGMKAVNENRKQVNSGMAYVGSDFDEKADELRQLINAPDHQLDRP